MNVAEFDFDLPVERIAQEPASRRDASRLMVVERGTGVLEHRRFDELPEELAPGDLVVLNDTKVFPARLRGRKSTGGEVEVLLVEPEGGDGGAPVWKALLSGGKSLRPGAVLALRGGLTAVVLAREASLPSPNESARVGPTRSRTWTRPVMSGEL